MPVMPTAYPYKGQWPTVHSSCCVAPGVAIVGQVDLGPRVSVWFNAVVRGDGGSIVIENETNIQDCAVVHCLAGGSVLIGRRVSIGHNAVIHGCTIEDRVLVGIGAIIMDGAVVKSGTVIGAGAVVTQGQICEPGLYMGVPARRHDLPADVEKMIDITAERYVKYAQEYLRA